jgi:hypothetical protein
MDALRFDLDQSEPKPARRRATRQGLALRIARSVLIYIKAQPGLHEHTCRTAPMARRRAACIGER